eukprot:1193126-Pleurochrysis_carterae.AAC.2
MTERTFYGIRDARVVVRKCALRMQMRAAMAARERRAAHHLPQRARPIFAPPTPPGPASITSVFAQARRRC